MLYGLFCQNKFKLGLNKKLIAEKINKKLKNVLEKNTELKSMFMIRYIIYGNNLDGWFQNLTFGEEKMLDMQLCHELLNGILVNILT